MALRHCCPLVLQPEATAADVLSWPVLGGMAALAGAVLLLALLLARLQAPPPPHDKGGASTAPVSGGSSAGHGSNSRSHKPSVAVATGPSLHALAHGKTKGQGSPNSHSAISIAIQ